jgi:anion-transporting  ArsA/GET3 family ATPase
METLRANKPAEQPERDARDLSGGDLLRLLLEQKLIVCVGPGGVGKTTASAALGLKAACLGKRALVITIDPARRLANSLGLSEIGNKETLIDPAHFERHGLEIKGSCHAMMLDTKSTFDDLINRLSPDNATRKRILSNNVYRQISGALGGSQEYMATEKLHDVHESGRYDLIILDTPPMKNALDFLEAQGRFLRFLDEKILKWFLRPYSSTKRSFGLGTGVIVHKLLGYVLGEEFIRDLTEFFICFSEMQEGFRVRHDKVSRLLRSDESRFIIITSPRPQTVEEADHFRKDLEERGLPFAGFIINQVCSFGNGEDHADEPAGEESRRALEELIADFGREHPALPKVLKRMERNLSALIKLTAKDQEIIAKLREKVKPGEVFKLIPRLGGDIYDMGSLLQLHPFLFGETA